MSPEHFNKQPVKVRNRSREEPMIAEKSSHKHDGRTLAKVGTAFTLPTRVKAVEGFKSDRK